ncbi:MAG: transglutaminase-like domain-containing protein, partial [Leadbetterella sp.]
GHRITSIIKLREESALTSWQENTIYATDFSNTEILAVKTIKKNGSKIDADGNEGRYVFKNLEVGDYIFMDYYAKQNDGDKTARFIDDSFYFNAYYPCFKSEYSLFFEEGLHIKDSVSNGKIDSEVETKEGFVTKKFIEYNTHSLKSENNSPKLNEIAKILWITNNTTWKDINKWYFDITHIQSHSDFLVNKTFEDIFKEKVNSDEEKAKKIYNYVCENISYSSVDFRQSGFIPQKASDVLNTKMGDCKDISTLFVSLARKAGLKADLALVSTSDRGRGYISIPSPSFNHCIVKLDIGSQTKYLELTDNKLPFGYLNNTHYNASVLDIDNRNEPNKSLNLLKYNKGYSNDIIRNTSIQIDQNNKMIAKREDTQIGNEASNFYYSYITSSVEDQKKQLMDNITPKFNSKVNLLEADFSKLKVREDSAKISYTFSVENEIIKVGSMKSLKIPFADLLAQNSLFEEENRIYPIEFNTYEPVDNYTETIELKLKGDQKFIEVPENINITWNGFLYNLEFKSIGKQNLNVIRKYQINREQILPKDYHEARNFFQKVIEAENTNIVFK